MQAFDPIAKHLVLVGGGHSHVIFIRMLAMKPIPGLRVTLLSPACLTPYSGMLPGVVAGHYTADEIHIDLVPLCRFAGVRFIKTSMVGLDPVGQIVNCADRPDISYDVVSINTGITPALGPRGLAGDVIAVKPISTFLGRFETFLNRLDLSLNAPAGHTAVRSSLVNTTAQHIAVVGAGAGGIELCLALAYRLKHLPEIKLHLLCEVDNFLSSYPPKVQSTFRTALKDSGVSLDENFRVESFEDKLLSSEQGKQLEVDEVFWVTDAGSPHWMDKTGLAVSERGFILVRDTLQTRGFDNVFAAGDIADMINHPRPKAGVYAVRQGPVLFDNVRRYLLGKSPKAFKPQADFLSLLSSGDKNAVASRNGLMLKGRWIWAWKRWIDKRFMARFQDLPKMSSPKQPGLLAAFDEQMQCGGCGSKVSGDLLSESLKAINLNTAQLDDAAIYALEDDKVMLHSIDAFKSFIDDPYILAQVAVHHALSDIYAMGGKPVTALSTITVQRAKPSALKNDLQWILAGAKLALDNEGVQLVGGHTTEGADLFIGFSVNGTANRSDLMTKAGAEVGDALILTKPLGSGVLFAADMQYQVDGNLVYEALESMLQSNRRSMEIFKAAGVMTCTDITGFGLAGHLIEILTASALSADLYLDKLPLFDGVLDLWQKKGISSTLHEGNQRSVEAQISGRNNHPSIPFIYDPQTSGGLLAAVAADQAEAVLTDLRAAGYIHSQVLGRVKPEGEAGRLELCTSQP